MTLLNDFCFSGLVCCDSREYHDSMEDQKALGFHQKYLNLFFEVTNVLRVWNNVKVSN